MSTQTKRRDNSYPGTCECGRFVDGHAGFLGDRLNGRWTVLCRPCVGKEELAIFAGVTPPVKAAAVSTGPHYCGMPGCTRCDADA